MLFLCCDTTRESNYNSTAFCFYVFTRYVNTQRLIAPAISKTTTIFLEQPCMYLWENFYTARPPTNAVSQENTAIPPPQCRSPPPKKRKVVKMLS